MKQWFLFMISLTCLSIYAQEDTYEYLGVLKLNDSSFIQYKLYMELTEGTLEGYSLSDAGGLHETRSNIRGSYDARSNRLAFEEYDIVYTKSPITELDFCLVSFNGKTRNLDRQKGFSGVFTSTYTDGLPCINGELIVSSAEKVKERIAKLDRKIQKSKKVSDSLKQKISVKRTIDTLTMSVVKKDENLNIFVNQSNVTLSVYDSGKVDDDRINVYVNDVLVLENFAIAAEKKDIPLQLQGSTLNVRVEAVNEGTSAPNTVRVELKDGNELIRTRTSLSTGEQAQLTLIKS